LRVRISLFVVAFTAVGLLSAAAQSYPPPPDDYYPAPPMPYPPQPRPYTGAPVPPLNVGTQPIEPRYDSGYDQQTGQYPSGGYSPAGEPNFVPADGATVPAQRSFGGEAVPRPPAGVGNAAAGDFTGSVRDPAAAGPAPGSANVIAALPPDDQPERGPAKQLPPQLRRQLVDYITSEPAGTIIIDTPHTYLYLVRGGGKALRYGIGVGREGFTWSGTERISRMSEWPDWHPPKEMIERQPYLPRFMAGGEGNPLGARALYLGNSLYRIHGTNQPSTIGHFVSSGCIRLTNEDIEDLYSRVSLGSRVVVLPGSLPTAASAQGQVGR
jgi:lipoprotein-anchoring transpeptidase ErfK/SrfK